MLDARWVIELRRRTYSIVTGAEHHFEVQQGGSEESVSQSAAFHESVPRHREGRGSEESAKVCSVRFRPSLGLSTKIYRGLVVLHPLYVHVSIGTCRLFTLILLLNKNCDTRKIFAYEYYKCTPG
jgi:hypothetical protein